MATSTRVNLTSSSYPFHVRGAGGQIGTLLISTTNSTSTAVRAQIALDDTSRTFSLTNNGQMAMAVDAAGRVGIATSSPQASFHVQGASIITGTLTLSGALVQPTGIVLMYAGATAPTGWLICDGSLVSKTVYSALYALLGSTFGTETTTQFYLPDMRGRSPLGVGTGSGLTARTLGGSGGAETHTLSISEMPSHNHGGLTDWCNQNWSHSHSVNFNNSTNSAGMAQESGAGIIDGSYSTNSTDTNHKHAITSEGGGGAHNNMQPWLALNFIIKT
jgi:microcystin-dependent protein